MDRGWPFGGRDPRHMRERLPFSIVSSIALRTKGKAMSKNATSEIISSAGQAAAASTGNAGAGPIIYIAIIVLLAGLVSGTAAYLTQPAQPELAQPPLRRTPWYTFCLLGVIAAACVPLFLSVVESGLMTDILAGGDAMALALLIFLGLCLLVALTARTFLDSLTRRILQQMEEIRERQNQAAQEREEIRHDVGEAMDKTERVAEALDEDKAPDPLNTYQENVDLPTDLPSVDEAERKLIRALGRKEYRTVSGVTEDCDLSRKDVQQRLQGLALKGIATTTNSSRTGGVRWMLTPTGRALMRLADG